MAKAWYDFMAVCTGTSERDGFPPGDPSSWCNSQQQRGREDRLRGIPATQRKSIDVDLTEPPNPDLSELHQKKSEHNHSWIPEYFLDEEGPENSRSSSSRRADERRKLQELLAHMEAPVPTPSTRSPATEQITPSLEAGSFRSAGAGTGHGFSALKSMSYTSFSPRAIEGVQQNAKKQSKDDKARKNLPPAPSAVPLWQADAAPNGSARRRTPPPVPISAEPESRDSDGESQGGNEDSGAGSLSAASEGKQRGGVHAEPRGSSEKARGALDSNPAGQGEAEAEDGRENGRRGEEGGRDAAKSGESSWLKAEEEEAAAAEEEEEEEGSLFEREGSWLGEMPGAEERLALQRLALQASRESTNAEMPRKFSAEEEEEEEEEEGRWECLHKHPQSFGRSGRVPAVVSLSTSGVIHVSFPSRSCESLGKREAFALHPAPSPRDHSGAGEPPPPTSSNQHTNKNGQQRKSSWLPFHSAKESPRRRNSGRRASKLSVGSGGGRRNSQQWATLGLAEVRFHCADLRDASHKFLGPSEGGAVKMIFREQCKLKLEGVSADKILAAVQGKASVASLRRRFQGERLLHLRRLARTQVSWSDAEHCADLQRFWSGVFPVPMPAGSLQMEVSPGWKDMGFQSNDPCTDFRAMGRLALGCLSYMVVHFKSRASRIVVNGAPKRDYPFGAVGVNIVAGLMGLLGLGLSDPEVDSWTQVPDTDLLALLCRLPRRQRPRHSSLNTASSGPPLSSSPSPSTFASSQPTPRGGHEEGAEGGAGPVAQVALGDGAEGDGMTEAFEEVFCATFELLDAIWVRDRPANILYFNRVLDNTWDCLKQVLASPHVMSIADLREHLRLMVPPPADDDHARS